MQNYRKLNIHKQHLEKDVKKERERGVREEDEEENKTGPLLSDDCGSDDDNEADKH